MGDSLSPNWYTGGYGQPCRRAKVIEDRLWDVNGLLLREWH